MRTDAEKTGLIPTNYWRNFTLDQVSERIPYLVPDAEKWVREAYLNFYFEPRYILSRLRHLNSWDSIRKHFLAAGGLLFFRVQK